MRSTGSRMIPGASAPANTSATNTTTLSRCFRGPATARFWRSGAPSACSRAGSRPAATGWSRWTRPSVALAAAREALDGIDNVTFLLGAVPGDLPPARFDLIVLSEVLYYLTETDAEAAMRCCCDRLASGGEMILCHWIGETDYPLTGEAAADLALRVGRERGCAVQTLRRPMYRLDRLLQTGA